MAEHDTPEGADDQKGPLSGLHPYARLALAGLGVLVGLGLIFLGLHDFSPRQDEPKVVNVPDDVGTLPPSSAPGAN